MSVFVYLIEVDFKNMKEIKTLTFWAELSKAKKCYLTNGKIGCPILLKRPSWHSNCQQIFKIVALGTIQVFFLALIDTINLPYEKTFGEGQQRN